jgi:hypothetical protein
MTDKETTISLSVTLSGAYVFANTSWGKPYRDFESHSLRQSCRDQLSLLTLSAHRSPITAGFGHKSPHCDTPAEAGTSLSVAVCLQTSRLRGFSTELVSA